MAFWGLSNISLEYILLYDLRAVLHFSAWTHPQNPSHHSAPGRHSQTHCSLIQGLASFLCKGPDSSYFRLFRPRVGGASVANTQ